MPIKDIILLVIVGGFVLTVWFAFRNLDKVAGSKLGELDEMTTRPIPTDQPQRKDDDPT